MEGDVGERIGQLPRFGLPTIKMDGIELGLLGYPVYDDARITKDLQVTYGPSGGKIEGRP
jgi:hypothetical protein